ncbi:competence protein CoiA family protein [Vibrio sp. 1159]|uniref:competence protein CoiA family protein n=1 Tax=Vibrio sp. 1159 TaxID=3074545 RepID=UPI0029647D40|nr:competence protein CoiA family protein [Vibrio sp. 1159]MDW2322699.1 competence protein CoiA family protein [Vibrio sp. 1159]
MVKMTRAFDQNGDVVSIDHVENGRRCNCTCIVCGTPLLARQGTRNHHHFSHVTQCNCDWSGETELHLLAKEVFLTDKCLTFTWLSLNSMPYNIDVHFSDVHQEVTLGTLRPDIVGTTIDGERVLIEICVTHPCDSSKIQEYRRQGQNVIEILLPKELLIGVDVMDVAFVREAIVTAEKKCISFNPISEFCKSMYQLNADVIKEQGSTLRTIRQEIGAGNKNLRILNNQISDFKRITHSWALKANEIEERAEHYAKQLEAEILSQQHVKQYLSDKDTYEKLRRELRENYSNEVKKAERDITAYEAKLKQDVHHRLKSSEANRLKSIQDELLEFSGGTLLQVDQYIQMINEKYENRFDELERNWIVLERQLARLNEHTKRPEFLKHENRKLPPLNSYNKVRG